VHRYLDGPLAGGRLTAAQFQLMLARPAQSRVMVILDGEVAAGLVGLTALDAHGAGEVWYLVGEPDRERRGLATAGVAAALDLAFGPLGLAAVRATVVDGHRASVRVLEKLGFAPAGRWRAAFLDGEVRRDRLWFDLLASSWRA
jgi:RimJ/RimL family protein N-acetyltransferase